MRLSDKTSVKGLRDLVAVQLKEITRSGDPQLVKPHNNKFLAACFLIFLLAIGVRLLTWHDLRLDVWKVQTYVTSDYKYSAYLLARRDFEGFLYDINRMGHPPGYPIFLAGIFKVWGDSDDAIQVVQIVCDSVAVVFVLLIALELFPFGVALIAGILAALSPQFAYHSVLLLPDSLAVLPLVMAVYLIVRALKQPRFWPLFLAGALIGISCWLRANALLMAPFLAICIAFVASRGDRLGFATAFLLGTLMVIAPVTIKNWIVFGKFVPLSLGAGQTLLEGMSDYDTEKQLNIPQTDLGLMRQEAEWYHNPEYALLLFGPDGIKRERMRLARGFSVIRSRPVWFLSVMGRRAISSVKLDRVTLVAPEAPVTHKLESADQLQPVWSLSPNDFPSSGTIASPGASVELVDESRLLRIAGDETKYGNQFVSPLINVKPDRDYVFRLPLKLEEGRVLLKVTEADPNATQQEALAASVIDLVEGVPPAEQALKHVDLPFVSGKNSQVRLVLANNASAPVRPVARMGRIELYELGASAYQWTHFPRLLIRNLQRFFLTAWFLPLTIFGIIALLLTRRFQTLLLLLSVPLYYLIVQSALHTERRYVIAIHYFLTILAALALWQIWRLFKKGIAGIVSRNRGSTSAE
ncbi:MAG TPA: glycosyltransferase family 39 protein [Pyrinomonadaceae bacterium]|nr:glycosyltransferase family 39 protein [Pyrinomonadaceae bacterium]